VEKAGRARAAVSYLKSCKLEDADVVQLASALESLIKEYRNAKKKS
jgi:hypothetical protein